MAAMPPLATDAAAPSRPLRAYFRNIAVWSVFAVPAGFGVVIVGMGVASLFVEDFRTERLDRLIALGAVAALLLFAPLVAVFARGWKRARGCGKGRGCAFGVGMGGLALAILMSAVYLAAASALTWLLFTKA